MNQEEILEERLGRYKRLEANEDYQKTLQDVDDRLAINRSAFAVLNSQGTEFLIAREGARSYSTTLRSLVKHTEHALEDVRNNNQGEMNE